MKRNRCEFCEGAVESVVDRVRFSSRGQTIYVDKVPIRKCTKCGEVYFDAVVFRKLESIAANRERIEQSISFPLADFEVAEVA